MADFHIHSTFSDGKLTIPKLVDLYGKRGFGAIAITDHVCEKSTFIGLAANCLGRTLTPATFPIYLEILKSEARRARDLYDMVVLPGFELSKNSILNRRSAHILGVGISSFLWADGDAITLARAIRSQGGIAIAAHPVSTRKIEKQTYYLWDRREELAQEFDAWEVASGSVLFPEVLESNLPKIANSDLHIRSQLSSWKTILRCDRTPEAVLDAVRRQEVHFGFYDEGDMHEFINVGALSHDFSDDSLRDFILPKAY